VTSPPRPFELHEPRSDGATSFEIETAESALNVSFPDDYRAFLAWSNGWEGWLGEAYLQFASTQDLPFANDDAFRRLNPRVLAIGGDGGLETFVLDYQYPGIPPALLALDRNADLRSKRWIAASFTAGVERLKREPEGPWDQADPELVRQYEAQIGRVQETLDIASRYVSAKGVAEAQELVDHGEAPLGMSTLAWIIVTEQRRVPRALIRDIRAHAQGAEPDDVWPPNLDDFAVDDV